MSTPTTEEIVASATEKPSKSAAAKQKLSSPWASLFAIVIAVLWTVPTLGLFISSFRPEASVKNSGWWTWFTNPEVTFSNYDEVLTGGDTDLATYFVNTIVITIPAVIIPISIATMAAYAFAWMKFPFRDSLFVAVFAMQIVPHPGHDDPAAHALRGPARRDPLAGRLRGVRWRLLHDLAVARDLRPPARDLPPAQLHEGDPRRADRGGVRGRRRSRPGVHEDHAAAHDAGHRGLRHLPVPLGLERPAGGAGLRWRQPGRLAAHGPAGRAVRHARRGLAPAVGRRLRLAGRPARSCSSACSASSCEASSPAASRARSSAPLRRTGRPATPRGGGPFRVRRRRQRWFATWSA